MYSQGSDEESDSSPSQDESHKRKAPPIPMYIHPSGPKIAFTKSVPPAAAMPPPLPSQKSIQGMDLFDSSVHASIDRDTQRETRRATKAVPRPQPIAASLDHSPAASLMGNVPPKYKPIASDLFGPFAGIVRIREWPYSLDKIQRSDGIAFRPGANGEQQRVYRPQEHYGKEWITEQLERQLRVITDPLMDFMREVAGNCRQNAEKDFFDAAKGRSTALAEIGSRGGTSSPFSFPDALLQSAIVSRGMASYSQKSVLDKALEYIGRGKNPVVLEQQALSRERKLAVAQQAENLELFSDFAFVFAHAVRNNVPNADGQEDTHDEVADISDNSDLVFAPSELRRIVRAGGNLQETITQTKQFYARSGTNAGYLTEDASAFERRPSGEVITKLRWLANIGFSDAEQSVEFKNVRRDIMQQTQDEAVALNRSALLERLETIAQLDPSESTEELFNEVKEMPVYKSFYRRYLEGLLRWWGEEVRTCNNVLKRIEELRNRLTEDEYIHLRVEWIAKTREANERYNSVHVARHGRFAPGAQEDDKAYQLLLDLFREQFSPVPGEPPRTRFVVPDMEKVLIWDVLHNEGRILESMKDAAERQRSAASDKEWVGLTENLGWAFMQDIFVAALRSAVWAVQNTCRNPIVYYMHLMMHRNVRTPFARLVAAYVKQIRHDNNTRPMTDRQVERNERDIVMLKQLFKTLTRGSDGYLYLSAVQSETSSAQFRALDRANADYTRRTGVPFSDLHASMSDAPDEGHTFGKGLQRRKLSYQTALHSVTGMGVAAQFDLARRNDVHMPGHVRDEIEGDREMFDNLVFNRPRF